MGSKTKDIVLKYLLSKKITIDGDRIYTDRLDFIKSDIIGVFGKFPLYELGFREIITKIEGTVFRQIFDEKGRITKFVAPNFESWETKYNENGDCIYFKGRGILWQKEFDNNHNCIYYKDTDKEWWKLYDKKGRVKRQIDSNGYEKLFSYDKNNKATVKLIKR